MKLAKAFLVAHLGALVFGIIGLTFVIPNLAKFTDPQAMKVYAFGMKYAGSLHIVFGALAMFAFGVAALGWRRTVTFFGYAVPISLMSELIGTSTGYPFGNYSYTNYLGWKVVDHVPFSIPLSWFYVGFACYILGCALADRLDVKAKWAWGIGIGVWLLTVWDLVLDPAMAHPDMPVKFWEWHETGPYMGMPVQNFLGWALTGIAYMGLSRVAWGADVDFAEGKVPLTFPLVVYLANTIFAMALSAHVGLWLPILLSTLLGLVPAVLAWRSGRRGAPASGGGAEGAWRPAPTP